jgi:ribosomal protein L40E
MEKRIKEIEKAFAKLKLKFRRGKISRQKFLDGLEKLRFKDYEGRVWMIGARSSQWYYFDGKDWIQSNPTSITEKKAICRNCGFANRLDADTCADCGESLRKKGKLPYRRIPRKDKIMDFEDKRKADFIFRSLRPFSFLLFAGAVGLILGIFVGAFIGATNYFSRIVEYLPSLFQENKGNLLGGVIYAGLGGALGFLVFGLLGFCNAIFINVISSLVGGIKIDIEGMHEE